MNLKDMSNEELTDLLLKMATRIKDLLPMGSQLIIVTYSDDLENVQYISGQTDRAITATILDGIARGLRADIAERN